MSALAQVNAVNKQPSQVTTISANARVDYILRFSKHAVIVLDNTTEVYSKIATTFLAELSDKHNAAFVSASSKLNDIQIRCRIIEQLFAGVLFDPEESLAVTLVALAKQHQQPVSIVIEHGQHLSLTLLNELVQLAELAPKIKRTIDVVIAGSRHIGRLLATEQALFADKLTFVSATSGQLISWEAPDFKSTKTTFSLSITQKFIVFVLILSFLAASAIYSLWQKDNYPFAQLPVIMNNETTTAGDNSNSEEPLLAQPVKQQLAVVEPTETMRATPAEIALWLNGENTQQAPVIITNAEPIDILSAIEAATETIPTQSQANSIVSTVVLTEVTPKAEQTVALANDDADYYLSHEHGVVVQLAGFTDLTVYQLLASDLEQTANFKYFRRLNQQEYLVVTSPVLVSKAEAQALIEQLPDSLRARGPWIKQLSTIKAEINDYRGSL